MSDKQVRRSPWITETVEGDPIQAGGHELVPLVRKTSHVRRRVFLGSHGVGGGGWGFVHMRPVAILDRSEAGERRHPVRGETARLIAWLCVVFLAVPLIAAMVISLLRRSGDRPKWTHLDCLLDNRSGHGYNELR
jgi:hypothetical protein